MGSPVFENLRISDRDLRTQQSSKQVVCKTLWGLRANATSKTKKAQNGMYTYIDIYIHIYQRTVNIIINQLISGVGLP